MHWGTLLEDVIAKEYAQVTGYDVEIEPNTIHHPEYKFLGANIDRWVDRWVNNGTYILECKTASFTKAKEWGDSKIRVNAICPGLIQTKFSEALWSNEKIMAMIIKQLAIKRAGTAEEIGAMALFLASPASTYTTGAILTADGGFTI